MSRDERHFLRSAARPPKSDYLNDGMRPGGDRKPPTRYELHRREGRNEAIKATHLLKNVPEEYKSELPELVKVMTMYQILLLDSIKPGLTDTINAYLAENNALEAYRALDFHLGGSGITDVPGLREMEDMLMASSFANQGKRASVMDYDAERVPAARMNYMHEGTRTLVLAMCEGKEQAEVDKLIQHYSDDAYYTFDEGEVSEAAGVLGYSTVAESLSVEPVFKSRTASVVSSTTAGSEHEEVKSEGTRSWIASAILRIDGLRSSDKVAPKPGVIDDRDDGPARPGRSGGR